MSGPEIVARGSNLTRWMESEWSMLWILDGVYTSRAFSAGTRVLFLRLGF